MTWLCSWKPIPTPSLPEAFKVLVKELQGLALDVTLLDKNNNVINLDAISRDSLKEEQKANSILKKTDISDLEEDEEEDDFDKLTSDEQIEASELDID